MPSALQIEVRRRAGNCCEYCRMPQEFDVLPFHVEHIIPRKHGGSTSLENLALACAGCNLAKSSNLSGHDPATGKLTRLFDPRSDRWSRHFEWSGGAISGRTAVGRTTIVVLRLNDPERTKLRRLLIRLGSFPM